MKLAFIADKSEAFVSYSRDKVLEEWGVESQQTNIVATVSQAGQSDLFGVTPTLIIPLEDNDAIRKAVEELKTVLDTNPTALDWGVILTTTAARTGTKTLEKLVGEAGGEVLLSRGIGRETPSEKLISELNLNRDAKAFLLSYIGDDYEAALPLIKAVSAIPPTQQTKITEDQLILRMPQPKGAVAPWGIVDPIVEGDITKAVDILRRTALHSHFLVAFVTIKSNITQAFNTAALLTENSKLNEDEIVSCLGIKKNYGVTVGLRRAKKIGLSRLKDAVALTAQVEAKVKGGSGADPMVTLEAFLVELSMVLGGLARD